MEQTIFLYRYLDFLYQDRNITLDRAALFLIIRSDLQLTDTTIVMSEKYCPHLKIWFFVFFKGVSQRREPFGELEEIKILKKNRVHQKYHKIRKGTTQFLINQTLQFRFDPEFLMLYGDTGT